eukprot:FR740077.1.p3 GENE.FR740077.1~~FR740077.1.p3  ORF type:complete len:112 (+),score=39.97 FR740077.1:229-564(+)
MDVRSTQHALSALPWPRRFTEILKGMIIGCFGSNLASGQPGVAFLDQLFPSPPINLTNPKRKGKKRNPLPPGKTPLCPPPSLGPGGGVINGWFRCPKKKKSPLGGEFSPGL